MPASSLDPEFRGGVSHPDPATLVALTDVNNNIFELASASIVQEGTWDFICECGDPCCAARIVLTADAYERLRDGGRAILAPGHHVDERARARALREDAQALHAQAEQRRSVPLGA